MSVCTTIKDCKNLPVMSAAVGTSWEGARPCKGGCQLVPLGKAAVPPLAQHSVFLPSQQRTARLTRPQANVCDDEFTYSLVDTMVA